MVDDDEVGLQFGETQYNEANIIPYNSEEPDEAKAQTALREAVLRYLMISNGIFILLNVGYNNFIRAT